MQGAACRGNGKSCAGYTRNPRARIFGGFNTSMFSASAIVRRSADAKPPSTCWRLRRTAKLEGRKLPAPRQAILFRTLCADALEHSRAENAGKSTHELEFKINELLPVFGDRTAGRDHQARDRPLAYGSGGGTRIGNHPAGIAGRQRSRSSSAWASTTRRLQKTQRPVSSGKRKTTTK